MHISQIVADIGSGVLIGLSIAIPVGPSCLLCVQRCLVGGLATGLATGLGISTVHAIYATLALQGASGAVAFVGAHSDLFTIASACLLFLFAARALKAAPRTLEPNWTSLPGRWPARLGKSYGSALLLGATNPMTVLFFLAVIPSFTGAFGRAPGSENPCYVVLGVVAGSFAWWSTVVVSVRVASRNFLDERRLRLVARASALSLALFGLAFLMPVVKGWVADRPHGPSVIVRGGMRSSEDAAPPSFGDLPGSSLRIAVR